MSSISAAPCSSIGSRSMSVSAMVTSSVHSGGAFLGAGGFTKGTALTTRIGRGVGGKQESGVGERNRGES